MDGDYLVVRGYQRGTTSESRIKAYKMQLITGTHIERWKYRVCGILIGICWGIIGD